MPEHAKFEFLKEIEKLNSSNRSINADLEDDDTYAAPDDDKLSSKHNYKHKRGSNGKAAHRTIIKKKKAEKKKAVRVQYEKPPKQSSTTTNPPYARKGICYKKHEEVDLYLSSQETEAPKKAKTKKKQNDSCTKKKSSSKRVEEDQFFCLSPDSSQESNSGDSMFLQLESEKLKKKRKKKNVSHGQDLTLDDIGIISDRKEERHDSYEQFKMDEKDYSDENVGTALPVRLISSPVYSSSSSCPTLDSVTLMSARFIELTQQEATHVKDVLSPFNDEKTYYERKRLDREKDPHKIEKPKKIVTNTEGDAEGDATIIQNFSITITKGTICRLRPGCWLDDEVKITI